MSKKISKCIKKDTLGPTAEHGVTMLPCCSLWLLRCHRRSGTEASRRGNNWMSECRPDMIRMIENHRFLMFFLALEEQNRVTAQAKRKFSLLSHTPANRNECPCCKHFLTTPANTSILSLSLKNQNFKFVTLSRAPSQPVALFSYAVCFSVLAFLAFELLVSFPGVLAHDRCIHKKTLARGFNILERTLKWPVSGPICETSKFHDIIARCMYSTCVRPDRAGFGISQAVKHLPTSCCCWHKWRHYFSRD